MERFGDWAKATKVLDGLSGRFQQAVERAMLREAHYLRGKIVQGIASGAPGGKAYAPLAPLTIAIREAQGFGGTKPMNRTGAFRGGVTVAKLRGVVFVGILRSARAKNGKSLANIGAIHEVGASWSRPMTTKQRRFIFAMLKKTGMLQEGPKLPGGRFYSGSDGMLHITIPARPTFGPVLEKYAKPSDVKKRFTANLAKALGYDLGKA